MLRLIIYPSTLFMVLRYPFGGEVAQPVRARAAEALAARVNSGELAEVYQRITTTEILAYIAGRS